MNNPVILNVKLCPLSDTVRYSKAISGQALRVPEGWGSQISRHSAHEGGKVVSPMHWQPLPLRKYSWHSFLLEAESTPRPSGLCQWKIALNPLRIKSVTFRLVVQCLDQSCHLTPLSSYQYFEGECRLQLHGVQQTPRKDILDW